MEKDHVLLIHKSRVTKNEPRGRTDDLNSICTHLLLHRNDVLKWPHDYTRMLSLQEGVSSGPSPPFCSTKINPQLLLSLQHWRQTDGPLAHLNGMHCFWCQVPTKFWFLLSSHARADLHPISTYLILLNSAPLRYILSYHFNNSDALSLRYRAHFLIVVTGHHRPLDITSGDVD